MDRSQIEDIYPLTPMQEGLLFQALFDETSPAYFLQMTLNWRGELRLDWLRECWRLLLRRHPVLRSVFVHEGVKRPLQITLKQRDPIITMTDLRHLGAVEQATAVAHYQTDDQAQGFDLQKDVLLRVAVFQLGDGVFQLVWSYHHILFDGWSFGVLQQEFVTIYRALARGERPSLPSVAPYRQYIRWLQAQSKATAVAHWRDYLAGYAQIATLPHLLPATDMFEFGQQMWVLDEVTTRGLQQVAVQCGATLNSLVRALWAVILGRYNNADDVLFGAIVSGRPSALPGVEEMVGLFINAVPVRVRLDGAQSFTELVQQVQQAALAGEAYHFLPLAEIQTLNSLGRDLFDHLLIFENYPMGANGAESADDFVIEGVGVHDRTHYDLDITVAPGERLTVQFNFNTAVYPSDQIERMVGHWQTAVQSILTDAQTAVADIEILPEAEQQKLLVDFNDSARDYPTDVTILDLFAEQVQKDGERTAVVMGDERVSYAALNGRVQQLAHHLQTLGVGTGVRVAICVERSVEMIVGVMGILQAGGAYVPLDPEYPAARIAFMLVDAEPLVLLTQSHLLARLPQHRYVVCVDGAWQTSQTSEVVRNTASAETLAYIIYTSGSTGQPKGVMVNHGNLTNAAFTWREVYRLDQFPMRSLQMASLSFDVFAGDLVRALTNGGQLVICPADVRVDPPALYELLAQHRINIFETTPALAVPLMTYIEAEGLPINFLEQLIIGSDNLPAANYRWLVQHYGQQMRIMNSYGATEATVDSSLFETADPHTITTKNTPIGKPLPNVQFYVLATNGRPAPIGVDGELVIGGISVAQGYWRREELTDLRFAIDDLRLSRQSQIVNRQYKTGDQARWLPDGNMEFLGRLDDQVKLRGYRIEAGEIEAQLLRMAGVETAVVLLKRQQLVAYLVGQPRESDELRHTLRQQLPDYMIPNQFIWLDSMRLTPNGKVDRKWLREREDEWGAVTTTYTPPRNETESQLADIWAEVLAMEQVGIHDNFFDLGGHSLKAMQVVSRIHQAFDVKISLRDFFTEATIAEQARLVGRSNLDVYTAIKLAPAREHYPLSHAQKRLWLQHQLDKAAAYNMPEAYLIEDELDVEALERTFRDIIQRHEALRTAFVVVDGEPVQRVLPEIAFTIRRVDLSTELEAETKAKTIVDEDANKLFDLTQPPLLRATFIKLAERRHIFALTIHHIIGDGWSGTVLYQEIMALYEAHRAGRPNPLPPLRIQYKDFALWQLARGFAKEEAYWLQKLAGVPDFLRLPTDFPTQAERDFRGSMVEVEVNGHITNNLRALAQKQQTTLSNVVLALFKLLLYQVTRQADLCVGVAIANRNHPDLENLLGFFVNILPLRTELSDEMDFDGLLTQVVAGMNEAFEHQDYPFDLLVEKLNPTRFANRQPILNVIYAFQSFGDVVVGERSGKVEGGNGRLSSFNFAFETSKFDLTLFVAAGAEAMTLTLEYDTSLFKRQTIERYLGAMARFAEMVGEEKI